MLTMKQRRILKITRNKGYLTEKKIKEICPKKYEAYSIMCGLVKQRYITNVRGVWEITEKGLKYFGST